MKDGAQWQPVAGTSLEMALTDSADTEVFDTFFAGYDRAFVLPNEKEDRSGFAACLALNHGAAGARLATKHGPFAEICLIVRDAATKGPVGGANFLAVQVRGDEGTRISANLNYIYVDAHSRGRGYFSAVIEAVRQAIRQAMGSNLDPLIFIELNDPFRMSAQDYARDTQFTGLDQLDRMRIWARYGARIVDFPYVQPALAPDSRADEALVYGLLSTEADLSACTLGDQLRKFFEISVLKGELPHENTAAANQLEGLRLMCANGKRIALLDPEPLVSLKGGRSEIEVRAGGPLRSVREALRLLGD